MVRRILLLSLLFVNSASAAVFENDAWALPLAVYYDGVNQDLFSEVQPMLHPAFALISALPLSSNHLFHWKGDRKVLKGKNYRVIFADSTKTDYRNYFGDVRIRVETTGSFLDELENGETQMTTVVFLDRILFEEDGTPRLFQFASYVMALAQHIYGPVQQYLQGSLSNSPVDLNPSREETAAALFGFLHNLVEDPRFYTMDRRTVAGFLEVYDALKQQEAAQPSSSCGSKLFH